MVFSSRGEYRGRSRDRKWYRNFRFRLVIETNSAFIVKSKHSDSSEHKSLQQV